MTLRGLLVFSIAYFAAVATPGPGVAAVLARALARGFRGMPAFIAGFVAGDLTLYAIAAAGLAVIAQSYAPLFIAIKWGGAAYLVYLAIQIWKAPVSAQLETVQDRHESRVALFLTTYSLTLGNPKPIIFFVALLPSLIDLETLTWTGFLEIAGIIAVIITATLLLYAAAATHARKLFSSKRALRLINRITATVLVCATLMTATH